MMRYHHKPECRRNPAPPQDTTDYEAHQRMLYGHILASRSDKPSTSDLLRGALQAGHHEHTEAQAITDGSGYVSAADWLAGFKVESERVRKQT